MTDPPIDNVDPKTEHDELLKYALVTLSNKDWWNAYPILKRPSDDHVRHVAAAALARINKLEVHERLKGTR